MYERWGSNLSRPAGIDFIEKVNILKEVNE